jgi:hypothetical protein
MVEPRKKGMAAELLAPTADLGGGARVSRTPTELQGAEDEEREWGRTHSRCGHEDGGAGVGTGDGGGDDVRPNFGSLSRSKFAHRRTLEKFGKGMGYIYRRSLTEAGTLSRPLWLILPRRALMMPTTVNLLTEAGRLGCLPRLRFWIFVKFRVVVVE